MIAVLGDVLVDIVALTRGPLAFASDTAAEIRLAAGGSAAGTAAWLAHDGQPVRLLGSIGDDALADLAVASLTGVDLALQRIPGERTGSCVVIVDAAGERTMLPDAGASTRWTWSPSDLDGTGHLHVSAYPLYRESTRASVLAAMASARTRGMTVSLDLASSAPLAQSLDAARAAIECADVVLANADEATALTGLPDPGESLDALSSLTSTAVVKLGARGCMARTSSRHVVMPAIAADVVDTTGAGDAFAAGFLPPWLSGAPLESCLQAGQASAVRTLGRVGAGPS